ncbi:unnamed protein product [Linum tenue]|uniref:Uncharacterized protein n=1 Tax=Linum tenue TaxID=586396 RepID=A0AAV0L9X9_9ROSI|nr:unnamed protein product [Linum tenue]
MLLMHLIVIIRSQGGPLGLVISRVWP